MSRPPDQTDRAARLLQEGVIRARELAMNELGLFLLKPNNDEAVLEWTAAIQRLDRYTETKFGLQALKLDKAELVDRIADILFPPKKDETNG